jgi:hypothetical protein
MGRLVGVLGININRYVPKIVITFCVVETVSSYIP